MSRKDPLDARKGLNDLSKRAEFPLGELLPEETREKFQPTAKPGEGEQPLPTPAEAEELPQPSKFPGGPQQTVRPRIPGQSKESPDIPGYTKHAPGEYTGMSPKELEQKRQELGVDEDEEEISTDKPSKPSWRDIAKEKLKSLDPRQKAKEKMEERFGPPEKLQEAAKILNEFASDMANVDINTAKNFVAGLDLPDIIKERADRILRGMRYAPESPNADENGEVPIGGHRIFQHALNQLGANSPKEVEKASIWLNDDPQGQQFLERARDQYLIRNAVNMIENTILRQEGEGVIRTGPRPERKSPQQRQEEKRIKNLKEQLEKGQISQEEFDMKLKGEEKKEEEEKEEKEEKEPKPETAPASDIAALNELQRKYNAGEISEEDYRRERARLLHASKLNLFKNQN